MKKSDIFSRNKETLDQGNQIFSVGGTPSLRLNRREHTTSNVFPPGCMGSISVDEMSTLRRNQKRKQETEEDASKSTSEEKMETKEPSEEPKGEGGEEQVMDEGKVEDVLVEGYVWKRNPLTGEGVETVNPRIHKKGLRKKLDKWVW